MIANPAKAASAEMVVARFNVPTKAILRHAFGDAIGNAAGTGVAIVFSTALRTNAPHYSALDIAGFLAAFYLFQCSCWLLLWCSKAEVVLTSDSIIWKRRGLFRTSTTLPLKVLTIKPVRQRFWMPYYEITSLTTVWKTIQIRADLERLEEFRETLSRLTGQDVPSLR